MWISKHMTVKFTIHRNLQTFLSSFSLSSLDETNSACKSCTLLTNSSSFCFCFWIKTPPNKQFSREKKYERKHRTCETILSETCINRRSSSLVERSLSWNSRNQGFQMNTKKKKKKHDAYRETDDGKNFTRSCRTSAIRAWSWILNLENLSNSIFPQIKPTFSIPMNLQFYDVRNYDLELENDTILIQTTVRSQTSILRINSKLI